MKISAINANNYQFNNKNRTTNANFKGLLIQKDSYGNDWDYQGIASGSSYDGHYQGSEHTYKYVYYPFKNESEDNINKKIDENNYTSWDAGNGYSFTTHYETTRGKTLPYTEREWNNLPTSIKEKFKEML